MKKLLILTLTLASFNSFSHGDHSTPGAIPSAPHGGVLGEVKHSEDHGHKHKHEHKEKKNHDNHLEMFFEARVKGEELKLYPLALMNEKEFVPVSLDKLKMEEVEIELPRSKKSMDLKIQTKGDHFVATLPKFRDRRFILEIEFEKDGQDHEVKIQLEKR